MESNIVCTIIKSVAGPGGRREVTLPDGSRIEDAFREARVDYAGYSINMDGNPASLGDYIKAHSVIVLSRKVEAGR